MRTEKSEELKLTTFLSLLVFASFAPSRFSYRPGG
jgi:hypothetical protein